MARAKQVMGWTAGVAVAALVLLGLAVLLFPWNWLRGPLDRRLSDVSGRGIAIDGAFSVHLGVTSRLVAEGVRIDSILALREESKPYPIRVQAEIGQTHASVDGTATDPLQLAGFAMQMTLAGQDMADIFSIFGIPIPHPPPYSLQGRLERQGDAWSFHDFSGRVGGSDLAGNLSVAPKGGREKLTATLVSQNLDYRDLGGFVGGKRWRTAEW